MSPHFFALFLRKARRFQREDFEMRLFLSSSRDVRKRPATERPRVKDSYEPVRASFTRNTYHHYSRSLRVPIRICVFESVEFFLSDDLFSLLGLQSPLFFSFFFGQFFSSSPKRILEESTCLPKNAKKKGQKKRRRRRQTTTHPKRTTKKHAQKWQVRVHPGSNRFFLRVSPFPSRSRALSSRRVRSDDG